MLKAAVIGSGYAARGHTIALRQAGVDVIALSSRNPEVCKKAAIDLDIGNYGTDWRAIIESTKPDMVAVATPAGAHFEVVTAAIEQGCHIYCEKPLALNVDDAYALYRLAAAANVKTAYAATCRYQPQIAYARELIERGEIGALHELEFTSHIGQPRLMPYGWIHRVESGGGRLYNHFPHLIGMAEVLAGGEIDAVMGACRADLKRAPIAGQVHHLHDFAKLAVTREMAAKGAWADVTSDFSYCALARILQNGQGQGDSVTALFRHGVVQVGKQEDYVAAYGEKGTIYIEHGYAEGAMFFNSGDGWRELQVPPRFVDAVPGTGLWPQRLWSRLAADFVKDISGHGQPDYLTFRNGWIYQQAIDNIRRGVGWASISRDDS